MTRNVYGKPSRFQQRDGPTVRFRLSKHSGLGYAYNSSEIFPLCLCFEDGGASYAAE